MKRATLLEYAGHRYLKLAGLLAAASLLAYAWHQPPGGPYGGTWLGYALGTVAALLVLAQVWYGMRRVAHRGAGTLRGRLSAHVYLGAATLVVATLHSGFQAGWNVHTLAYLLLLAAAASGAYGVHAYLRIPRLMTENMGEDSLDSLRRKIADLDELARQNALQLSDEINALVARAARGAEIGGGVLAQLSGRRRRCPNAAALRRLDALGRNLDVEQSKRHHELYSALHLKEMLLARARLDVAYKARLEFWLCFHVPLAVAATTALAVHVFSVFFYR